MRGANVRPKPAEPLKVWPAAPRFGGGGLSRSRREALVIFPRLPRLLGVQAPSTVRTGTPTIGRPPS